MNITCCPQYTIKCDTIEVHISKSQKKVLKKVNRFLSVGDMREKRNENSNNEEMDDYGVSDAPDFALLKRPAVVVSSQIISENPLCSAASSNTSQVESKISKTKHVLSVPSHSNTETVQRTTDGIDPNKPLCKKAKLMRLERRQQKLAAQKDKSLPNLQHLQTEVPNTKRNTAKSLEDFLNGPMPEKPAHKLDIRLVRTSPPSAESTATLDASYAVYRKYQIVIHKDPPAKCSMSQYRRFLVESPLEHEQCPDGPASGYGSFHQQYWLDGKLIAVGVIDILPNCVSSVYFCYDPDYSFLSMGTYASLREIAFTRQLSRHSANLHFYYMGFYIHSCPKMRYKGQYKPSYLLCPETFTWHLLDDVQPKLDRCKYSCFGSSDQGDGKGDATLFDVRVLHKRRALMYTVYKTITKASDSAEVEKYARMVGKECARKILLYRA